MIPANINPAPTKADNPAKEIFQKLSTEPRSTRNPAAIRTCRSSDIAFFAANDRQSGLFPGGRTAFDVDHVEVAGLDEFFAGFAGAVAAAADHIQRLVRRAVACLHDGGRIERLQWRVACDGGMDLTELGRRSHVDQVDVALPVPVRRVG